MRSFEMERPFDETGVSGTGIVLEGVEFFNGKVVVCWKSNGNASSIGIFNSFEDFCKIHVDSHPNNKTVINWYDNRI